MASTLSEGLPNCLPPPTRANGQFRILESTLRTANNLLEKLHASFFFYILTGPGMFMKIGSYLPSAILISVSLMLGGLQEYSNAGWTQTSTGSIQRRRPVLQAIAIMASLHVAFGAMFVAVADQHVVSGS
jgi:glycosylphosphatidylinositol transamidase